MERENNMDIVKLRSELRSNYSEWTHSKKSGLGGLPREYSKEDTEKIRIILVTELGDIQNIKKCCERLIQELDKESSKLLEVNESIP